jgi:D-alanine-D-alanine ligase
MRVLLLMGGDSPEREVSLASGAAVARALRERGHEVLAWDPGPGALLADHSSHEPTPDQVAEGSRRSGERWGPPLVRLLESLGGWPEVVFIALHGGWGEDGGIQTLLEACGQPYTGSGPLASALAMNKVLSKLIFEARGLPVTPWRLWQDPSQGDTRDGAASRGIPEGREQRGGAAPGPASPADPEALAAELGGWPLVVKPPAQGSSVGVTIVERPEGMAGAVAAARRAGGGSGPVLVEAYIPGREVTVGILGDRALPTVEILPKEGFYDYERKYTPGASEYRVPAPLPEALEQRLRALGLEAFRALGCRGFARVDFRLDPQGNPYLLEVNTIPGMTATSLLPMAARAAGLEFPELVEEICRLALEASAP